MDGREMYMPACVDGRGCGKIIRQTDHVFAWRETMKLASTAFSNGASIPLKHTGDGQDLSPPLSWSGAPAEAKSFALICDDPDAPSPKRPAAEPWVHWVIFNIPADRLVLPEGVQRAPEPGELPGVRQGRNSWPKNHLGYRGPAPPPASGKHRYFFKIYALDAMLALHGGATKQELLKAMSGCILDEAQTYGTYER